MRVAIISAYYKEPIEVLKRCYDSVIGQSYKDVTHFMVSDGVPNAEIDDWDCVHIRLPNHADYGDTPRLVGAASAVAQGYDAVIYLDADNYLALDHVERIINYQRLTGSPIITTTRYLCDLTGAVMGVCSESNGREFNDTNCYFITKDAFSVLKETAFRDRAKGITGDRFFWDAVKKSRYGRSHYSSPTVYYVSTFACHYQACGRVPPPTSKVIIKFSHEEDFTMVSFPEYCELMSKNQRN